MDTDVRKLKLNQARRLDLSNEIKSLSALSQKVKIGEDDDVFKEFSYKTLEFRDVYSKFLSVQDDIYELYINMNKEIPQSESDILNETKASYYKVIGVANSLNLDLTPKHKAPFKSSEYDCGFPSLPPIQLPTFSGNLENFLEFNDLYCSLIHKNDRIPAINKYRYLKTSLRGDALNLIKTLPFDAAHYEIAYSTLVSHYKNDRLLAMRHLENLVNCKPVKPNDKASLEAFLNTFNENVTALKNLKIVQLDKFILFYLAVSRADSETVRQFELDNRGITYPTVESFITFGMEYVNILKTSESQTKSSSISNKIVRQSKQSFNTTTTEPVCPLCNGKHHLPTCYKFKSLSADDKRKFIIENKFCFKCLTGRHQAKHCNSSKECRCGRTHHPLLCESFKSANNSVSENSARRTEINSCSSTNSYNSVLLGTVTLSVFNNSGYAVKARAIVDSGSMVSFITDDFCKRLGTSKRFSDNPCTGIGSTQLNTSNYMTTVNLISNLNPSVEYCGNFIITRKITNNLPPCSLPKSIHSEFSDLILGDNLFCQSSKIDMLIGADLYPQILSEGPIVKRGTLVAYPTVFGHVITGPIPTRIKNPLHCNLTVQDHGADLLESVSRFWELEKVPDLEIIHPDDEIAESQFQSLYCRSEDGRYNSPILCKPNICDLGDSFKNAELRLKRLEKSLDSSPDLRSQYNDFMQEYLDLGHMKPISSVKNSHLIPHHAVFKNSSTTTKCRVVFDGSARTTSGLSLNDCLYVGKRLQQNNVDILLRFRFHKVALVADIRKMYRMVNIIEDHRKYQHILFRFNPHEPIQEYELMTNSYGLASAAFVANRCIVQLALDEGHRFPAAAAVIPRDIYIDDFLGGSHSVSSAKALVSEIMSFLMAGGFEMRKWCSNAPEALSELPESSVETKLSLDPADENQFKVLGIHWNSAKDFISFHINLHSHEYWTKRNVLSTTAKLYDPLGWVSPVIFLMKHFFQTLWKLGYDWDTPIEGDLLDCWLDCVSNLNLLSNIEFPRFIEIDLQNYNFCQLLGFCDASERGYCAVVYARRGCLNGPGEVSLLTSKTRLAPVKTLTIPRLELLACHLLKNLLVHVHKALAPLFSSLPVFAWTDSTIALNWLNTQPFNLKTFVAHRVADIIQCPLKIQFAHISSPMNPADLGSRGLTPQLLIHNDFWFKAHPDFAKSFDDWPRSHVDMLPLMDIPESKPCNDLCLVSTVVNVDDDNVILNLIDKMSSFQKLLRIVSLVLQFVHKSTPKLRRREEVSCDLERAMVLCIKLIQFKHFRKDLSLLQNRKSCSVSLQRLAPFLDNNGLIRVGGRLSHSQLSEEAKHPYLLPKHDNLTYLIIDELHIKYLHVGPSTLMSLTRRKFWILSARSVIRQRVYRCVKCARFRANVSQPQMGSLPASRVVPSRPFSKVGLDYAGPFLTKEHKRRGSKLVKVYLLVFVCFGTKAVHFELVSELTTVCFFQAFDRFCGRRGLPTDLFSDCGTSFKGAAHHLNDLYKAVSEWSSELERSLSSREIVWHFNPPYAPAFGGIWEAAVKSAKTHIMKIVGAKNLTFEEFYTLLVKIEAILNSRPLTPISNSPSECDILTPGHFLVGGPLVLPPERNLLDAKVGLLKRWQYVQFLSQQFWSKWSREYLHTLQERSKWFHEVPNLLPGTIVLVKGENTSPSEWPLAKVVETHPGRDSVVRVVDLQVGRKLLRRPVSKVVPLPTSE